MDSENTALHPERSGPSGGSPADGVQNGEPAGHAGVASPENGGEEQAGSAARTFVEVWTDGGCRPNPGPGGWGVLLRCRGVERELSGGDEATTNNRMELTAAAEALEALTRPCVVSLHTDSEYVRNGITRWHTGWVRRNWRNASGDPVANMDLWRRLLDASKRHEVSWHWVKGHSGVPENERVDQLATDARKAVEDRLSR